VPTNRVDDVRWQPECKHTVVLSRDEPALLSNQPTHEPRPDYSSTLARERSWVQPRARRALIDHYRRGATEAWALERHA
jgi:hypothetical protein